MLNLICRLCSSPSSLISLFGGKCRTKRNYIRKIVACTTGIKFEKNDIFKTICYTCVVEIYNFYIFRAKSLENESKLKNIAQSKVNFESDKGDTLDDLELPSLEELQNNLGPWLRSKENSSVINDITKNGKTDDKKSCITKETTPETNSLTLSRAYSRPKLLEKETQYIPVKTFNIAVQSDIPELRKQFISQTVQCSLIKENNQPTVLKCQTAKKSCYNVAKGIQCSFEDLDFILNRKVKVSTIGTQTLVPSTNQTTQVYVNKKTVQLQCNLFKNSNSNKNQKNNLSSPLFIQTNGSNSKTGELSIPGSSKVKSELTSPVNLSPVTALNIYTDISKSENLSPVVTPSCPLLTVRDRSDHVKICTVCDKICYSKQEISAHKKTHLLCQFCKKRFRSMKQIKDHLNNKCKIKVLQTPVVPLLKLEDMGEVRQNHPLLVKYLKKCYSLKLTKVKAENNWKPIRLRSRSLSSCDAFNFPKLTCCECTFSVIKNITLGVDKAVQTSEFDFNFKFYDFSKWDLKERVKKRALDEDVLSPNKKCKLKSLRNVK